MERVLNFPEEMEKMLHPPARRYVKNIAKAIFRTPADIYEHPTFYSFVLDMPGLEAANIKVKVENGILHVAGKKKKNQQQRQQQRQQQQQQQGNEGGAVKALRIERRRARYMRKFTLPEDAIQEVHQVSRFSKDQK